MRTRRQTGRNLAVENEKDQKNEKVARLVDSSHLAKHVNPIDRLKQYIVDVESGKDPKPKQMFMITVSDDNNLYSWLAAGVNYKDIMFMLELSIHDNIDQYLKDSRGD